MMERTDPSPLALKLEELVRSGLVVLNPWSPNGFPTARIVVQVYDSGGTQTPPLAAEMRRNAQLARDPERDTGAPK